MLEFPQGRRPEEVEFRNLAQQVAQRALAAHDRFGDPLVPQLRYVFSMAGASGIVANVEIMFDLNGRVTDEFVTLDGNVPFRNRIQAAENLRQAVVAALPDTKIVAKRICEWRDHFDNRDWAFAGDSWEFSVSTDEQLDWSRV